MHRSDSSTKKLLCRILSYNEDITSSRNSVGLEIANRSCWNQVDEKSRRLQDDLVRQDRASNDDNTVYSTEPRRKAINTILAVFLQLFFIFFCLFFVALFGIWGN